MHSILYSKAEDSFILFIILYYPDLTENSLKLFKNIETNFTNTRVYLINMHDTWHNIHNIFKYNVPTFYRISFFYLFPQLDKIIYLDGDTLTFGDLQEMINLEMKDKALSGFLNCPSTRLEAFGYPGKRLYICGGVLLMNLKLMRELNSYSLIKEFLFKYKDFNYDKDQDLLNFIYIDKIGVLPVKFGIWAFEYEKHAKNINNYHPEELRYDMTEFLDAYKNPVIMHMNWPKPWWKRNAKKCILYKKWWDLAERAGLEKEAKEFHNKQKKRNLKEDYKFLDYL